MHAARSLFSGGGSAPLPDATAEDRVSMVNQFLNSSLSSHLGVQINYVINVVHGRKSVYNATTVLYNIGLGATSRKERCSEGKDFHKKTIGRYACLERRSWRLLQAFRSGLSDGPVESENIHVFLSFRGETRAGFTSHLHKKLMRASYRTSIDKLMKRGENIEKELIKAIKNLEVSVVVISPGYVSSQSCLDELIEILWMTRFGHKVLLVFSYVDPDDVSNLKADFGRAFYGVVESLDDKTDERVNRWKKALREVTSISGLVLCQNKCEADFIEQIVAEVKQLLSPAPQRAPPFVVLACALLYLDSTRGFIVDQILNLLSSWTDDFYSLIAGNNRQ